jgi:hypothetical protein
MAVNGLLAIVGWPSGTPAGSGRRPKPPVALYAADQMIIVLQRSLNVTVLIVKYTRV